MIAWCCDKGATWRKAHAVRIENDKLASRSLCNIAPFGGWYLALGKDQCKNGLREIKNTEKIK